MSLSPAVSNASANKNISHSSSSKLSSHAASKKIPGQQNSGQQKKGDAVRGARGNSVDAANIFANQMNSFGQEMGVAFTKLAETIKDDSKNSQQMVFSLFQTAAEGSKLFEIFQVKEKRIKIMHYFKTESNASFFVAMSFQSEERIEEFCDEFIFNI